MGVLVWADLLMAVFVVTAQVDRFAVGPHREAHLTSYLSRIKNLSAHHHLRDSLRSQLQETFNKK